ncbi:MAG: sodium:solute symporter family protein [Schwartzia sp.]|nr:sodium:solute symporter family protein [Schwartzia sp. (in: firmicutes)]
MELSAAHIGFMVITVAAVMAAGIYAAREVKSAEGYSLGGRSAGAAMVAGSIAGTVVGGGATVGTAQMAFSVGLPAWWFTLGSGIAFILMGLFYAKPLRQAGLTTIPEYLSVNYGKTAGTIASVVSSAGILFSAVASCLPGIGILSAVLGIGPWLAALILVTLVALYTFFGGMKSAGVGGMLKMGVIWLSLFFAGITAWQLLPTEPAFSETFPSLPWQSLWGKGVSGAMANLFSLIVGILCTQTYIQAIFSAASPRMAAAGAFMAALIVIPVGLPSVAIGMYMRANAPETIPVLVLPVFLAEHLPPWLGGIALGGIALSLISSIGGLSLGIGTMLSHDLLARLLAVRDEGRLLFLTRGVVLGVMAVACLVAILNLDSQVLMWNYLSMALRGAGIFLPLSAAVFLPGRIAPRWAVVSMAVSTVAAALFSTVLTAPIDPLFIGLIISALLMVPGFRGTGRPV